jgi:hypothetical protein
LTRSSCVSARNAAPRRIRCADEDGSHEKRPKFSSSEMIGATPSSCIAAGHVHGDTDPLWSNYGRPA